MVALSRSPDPDLALLALDRIRTADEAGWPALDRAVATDRGLRGRLLAVFGGSSALADFVISREGEWRRLLTDRQHAAADYASVLLDAVEADATASPGSPGRAPSARCGPPTAGCCWRSPPTTSATSSSATSRCRTTRGRPPG